MRDPTPVFCKPPDVRLALLLLGGLFIIHVTRREVAPEDVQRCYRGITYHTLVCEAARSKRDTIPEILGEGIQ